MDIKALTDQHLFNTYKRNPLVIKRAKGSWVWDERGKKYLDFFSGIAVSGIGHRLPAVVAAIQSQSKKLLHASNLFYTEPAALLAQDGRSGAGNYPDHRCRGRPAPSRD